MSAKTESRNEVSEPKDQPSAGAKLAFATVFGLIFGFLLQKGGVAKFNVLIGQLLLQDWTVAKVMMSAILVGMIGVYALHRVGKVKLHIQPTRLGANTIGGLIFGIGFALIAYCPGTGAAAIGQGNWDALFGLLGLMAGSYLYAELSEPLDRTLKKWGDRGKVLIPDVLHVGHGITVAALALILIGLLIALEKSVAR